MMIRATLLAVLAAGYSFAQQPSTAKPAQNDRTLPVSLHELSVSLERLTARVRPAVVQVFTTGLAPISEESEGTSTSLFTTQRATGSGIIMSPDGLVLTNAHVVRGGRRIQVRFAATSDDTGSLHSIVKPAGKTVEAKVVGVDRESDLAVLKVDASNLPYLRLGDSTSLSQGQLVMAFGNPLGLEGSVSMGVISSVARQIKAEDPMIYIQTDAPINPGNSGGPLIDSEGQVVGINTFILSQSGGSEGLGFAVPSDIAKNVYTQLVKDGHVHRGQIGVYAQTITPLMAEGLKLPQDSGVILGDVDPDGPAADAGLKAGDIVVSLNGKAMENARQFNVNLYSALVKETVTVEFLREGQTRATKVQVVERDDDPMRFADKVDPEKNVIRRLGILAVALTPEITSMVSDLRRPYGVVVALRSTDAAANGLEVGDVIYSVNGAPVKTFEALRSAIDGLNQHQPAVLQIQRDDKLRFVTIEIE
jgi:serine protease Do